jgi:CheY-like chemotaxis protein
MNSRQQVRLVIADDHPIFRDGLRRLLEAEGGFKVIREASDGAEAVKLARQLKPDILLLDLDMPKHPGLEALRELSVPVNATPVRVILLAAAAEKSQSVGLAVGRSWRRAQGLGRTTAIEGDSNCDGWRVLVRPRERL